MPNLFKIAFNAFRESLREPVYCLMLLAALFFISAYPALAVFSFSQQLKLVIDSSMATGLLFGLVVAVLCAGSTVAREMRNGTVLLLMSKPVARWSFILGKILGVAAAVIKDDTDIVADLHAEEWRLKLFGYQLGELLGVKFPNGEIPTKVIDIVISAVKNKN